MLTVGSLVNVIGLPTNNVNYWNIPETFVGIKGAPVFAITNAYIIVFIEGAYWNFPADYEGILELVITNKWNPMNYVPRLEPMKLP